MSLADENSEVTVRTGLEACAWAVVHGYDHWALVGGEGARRLGGCVEAIADGRARPVEGRGEGALRAAQGLAAAGRSVALLASGSALAEVLDAFHDLCREGLPVVLLVPSHGAETGRSAPSPELTDLALVLDLPAGALVAASAHELVAFTLAACRASRDRQAPWVVAFELSAVGLSYSAVTLPDPERVRAFLAVPGGSSALPAMVAEDASAELARGVSRYGFALGAALRDLAREAQVSASGFAAEGARDASVALVASGAGARWFEPAFLGKDAATVTRVRVSSWRPFPSVEVARTIWRARAVVVLESLPTAVGSGGRLSDTVKAALADAISWHPGFSGIGRVPPVVALRPSGEVTDPGVWRAALRAVDVGEPPRCLVAGFAGTFTRIAVALEEPARDPVVRAAVRWLAQAGRAVAAFGHEPGAAELVVPGRSAFRVLVADHPEALRWEHRGLGPGSVVLWLGAEAPSEAVARVTAWGARWVALPVGPEHHAAAVLGALTARGGAAALELPPALAAVAGRVARALEPQ
ncbi:MAG: hypothetical protein HY909_01465 [Deltaproteobacteria bacterium]|nr:hypothetical protein [Deltaproteobacteria bacterium]